MEQTLIIPVATDWAITFCHTWQKKLEEPASLFFHLSPTEVRQFVFIWDGWWHAAMVGCFLSSVSTACDSCYFNCVVGIGRN